MMHYVNLKTFIDPLQLRHFRIVTVAIRHVGVPAYALAIIHSARMAKETAQKGFIPGYASTIADAECKQRYAEKLKLINGHDPYELPREEWKDNIDMWPAITYVHVCMYLILYPSPYTNDDMLNYKSLDSFQNFQNGWVREVLVKEVGERKIIIGKVSYYIHCM